MQTPFDETSQKLDSPGSNAGAVGTASSQAPQWQRHLLRAGGVFLLLLPYLPLDSIFDGLKDSDSLISPKHWLNGLLCIVLPAVLLTWLIPQHRQEKGLAFVSRCIGRLLALPAQAYLAAIAAVIFLFSRYAFRHKPHLVDSVVQLFQARIFSMGMVKAPVPKYPEFFMTQHMIFDPDGWYGQYPPLQSVFLTIGELLSFGWLPQWLFAIATAAVLFFLAKLIFDQTTAKAVLLIMLCSPFYLFMSAEYMNHVPTLFFVSLFLLLFALWERDTAPRYTFLAGLSIAAVFLIRPLVAIVFGGMFGLLAIPTVWRRRAYSSAIAGVIGFALLASMILVYNHYTTGDALLHGYIKLWGPSHGLGFHTDPWGENHTPLTGLRNELIDLSLLNGFLFESPIPGMIPIALFLLCFARPTRWDARLTAAMFAMPLGQFFYWHRDPFLGPRFLYETLPCIFLLTARGFVAGLPKLAEQQLALKTSSRSISLYQGALWALLLTALLSFGLGIPLRFALYQSNLATMKRTIVADARKQGIDDGLIFIKVSWGNRLLARMRGLGVSASRAQRSYSTVDHCILQGLLDGKNLTTAELEAQLDALSAQNSEFYSKEQLRGITKDLSIRLRIDVALTERCEQELQYDQTPFSVYVSALLENSPLLDTPIVVATDLRERNHLLKELYPAKKSYLYDGKSFRPLS